MKSKNFSQRELECPCCQKNEISSHLLNRLQRLRDGLRQPIVLTSAYRCSKHNADVQGNRSSRHLMGEAIDISTRSLNGEQKYRLLGLAISHGFAGIGIYPSHFHLDIRRSPCLWVSKQYDQINSGEA